MKKINIFIFSIIVLLFTSCEKAFMNKNESSDPLSVFDYLWDRIDQQYVYFDVKGVDWDSVRTVYRAKVYEGMSDDSLFRVCAAMINTLCDGHTNLKSDFDRSTCELVYYTMTAESNYNDNLIKLHYLGANGHKTGGISHASLRGGKVAYLRYYSFMDEITPENLIYLTDLYKDCDGMILDLRQNGGGSGYYVTQLLSIFDCHQQPIYSTQTKAGPKHGEFTTLRPVHAPAKSILEKPYTKPVAVLIDRGSFSATSFFSVATQAFDNVKLFGDKSGGGLGAPNGGLLPNGWAYRFSITRTIALDGGNYENGVPPEVRVLLDPAAVAQGKDNIIETAADWIENGTPVIAKR